MHFAGLTENLFFPDFGEYTVEPLNKDHLRDQPFCPL